MEPNGSMFKGRNFITPDIEEYGWINEDDDIAYELSSGRFLSNYVIGVTLNSNQGLNMSFTGSNRVDTIRQAKEYIRQLKK